MTRLLAGLVSFLALGADGGAQPQGSRLDVAAALERIRDTGVFPEYLSLEYVELHRAVAEAVAREPHGYVAELAGRLLTRVAVNLERPLVSSDDQASLTADLVDGPDADRVHRADFYGSLDGGPWRLLTQLGAGGNGSPGTSLCQATAFGARACAPGWHSVAMRVVISALAPGSDEPAWTEIRELPTQVYGVYRKSDLARPARPRGRSATPAAWMRTVLDLAASSVDAHLDAAPLRTWLPSALGEAGRPDLARGLRWESRACGIDMVERFADRSRAPICVVATAGAGDLELSLEFSVGPLAGETGRRSWPEQPALHLGQVSDHRGSLSFSRLSELSTAFEKPRQSWPAADLRIVPADIVYSPLAPNAGDAVTVEFTIHNDGSQDARAMIEFWLNAPGMEQEERLDFIADVPAGRYYRFTRSIRVPEGSATGFAGAQAKLAPPRGSMTTVEERNGSNNDAVQLLGTRR